MQNSSRVICSKVQTSELNLHFLAEILAYIRKKQYLCSRKSFGKCVTCRKKSVGKCVTCRKKSVGKCVTFNKKSYQKGVNFAKKSV